MLVLGLFLAAGCGEDGVVNPTPPQDPQHIAVRSVLIGFNGSVPRDTVHAANYGVMLEAGEYQRNTLPNGFGDVAFALVPDSIGLANYDATANPCGCYVINRIE